MTRVEPVEKGDTSRVESLKKVTRRVIKKVIKKGDTSRV